VLRAIYTQKRKKCAGQVVLDHERGHGRVARREYGKLAAEIKALAGSLFANKRVPDVETVGARVSAALRGGVLAKFQERLDAAQKTYHGRLAQAEIVKKKCRLVERKR